ncbi:hypothetical protein [Psychrobacter alimentarius]|uniref:hypothetical protein n=1 Tax=Psychrobacter alimentarius TaxID=261164 RepID=UPI003FD541CD
MRQRNAGIKKLRMPAHQSYARVSPNQAEIDEYIAKHGVRQLTKEDNTGKVFIFNGRGNRTKRKSKIRQ